MKLTTKLIRHYPPNLRHVAWEIKNSNFLQIFSTYGKMQTNCIFVASNFVVHRSSTNFETLGVSHSKFFTILIADKIFCVTVFF